MSLKSWFLDRLQIVGGAVTRADLDDAAAPTGRGGEPVFAAEHRPHDRSFGRAEPSLDEVLHLGTYGPLVAAIRDELEQFVASHVRLHLAIADRDRFLLTAIAVSAPGDEERRRSLERFMREFKPEQLKRYLARELIAGLPNASALDLSQFGGLVDADAARRAVAADEGDYRELIEALTASPNPALRPYRVELVGRWTELDAPLAARGAGRPPSLTPSTPLAGARFEFDLEDADGRRRVVLPAVIVERRYVIGKGEGCDIRVNGAFASRRHAELWFEGGGAWRVADVGSTNGIRVEDARGARRDADDAQGARPLQLAAGDRLVLSARAQGPAADYPWISLRMPAPGPASRVTPIASAAVPQTPLTAVLGATAKTAGWRLTLVHAAGTRTLALDADALPVRIGRSRSQTLVVDRAHDAVSGRHLEIVGLDDDGAQIVVHGDNGIVVGGVPHASGSRLSWKPGELLVLGACASQGNAGPPQVSLTPAGGGSGAARPWGRSDPAACSLMLERAGAESG